MRTNLIEITRIVPQLLKDHLIQCPWKWSHSQERSNCNWELQGIVRKQISQALICFEDKSSHLLVTAPLLPGLWGSSQCWWYWAHASVSYFGISPERNILTVIFCSLFFQERKHARRYLKEYSQPTMLLPDWLTYLDKCRLRSGLSAIRCV